MIAPITITHYRKRAIVPAMNLVSLQPPLQQMHWSKTFILLLREAKPTELHHEKINLVDCSSDNNENC
jgi:hypothetical protein